MDWIIHLTFSVPCLSEEISSGQHVQSELDIQRTFLNGTFCPNLLNAALKEVLADIINETCTFRGQNVHGHKIRCAVLKEFLQRNMDILKSLLAP